MKDSSVPSMELQQKKSLIEAFLYVLKNCNIFSTTKIDRLSRRDFWLYIVGMIIPGILIGSAMFVFMIMFMDDNGIIGLPYFIGINFISLSLNLIFYAKSLCYRINDMGKRCIFWTVLYYAIFEVFLFGSHWHWLWPIIPFYIVAIIVFCFTCCGTKMKPIE